MAKIFNSIARAKWVHYQIDQHIEQLFKDPVISKHTSCKKSCQACCHSQVSISNDEAELLLKKIVDGVVKIDIDKLAVQKSAGNSAKDWYQIDYKTRACVFLDQAGLCSVYADRPSVCRTNYVVSDPSQCSTENGNLLSQSLLNTYAADMVLSAGYIASKGGGALPRMIWDALIRHSKKKSYRKKSDLDL